MNVLDLFSGIGGFSLGLERAGMETVAFCEIDPFCRKILRKHWPETPIYEDVRDVSGQRFWDDGLTVSIQLVCGGFPCQPWSLAGERRGTEDDRDLWPEMRRVIDDFRPRWVIGENVPGLDDEQFMGLDRCLSDLDGLGYQAVPLEIPACAVGARHKRNRIWIVAHAECNGGKGGQVEAAGKLDGRPAEKQLAGLLLPCSWPSLPAARACRNDDGLPNRVHRNIALGNSVVPQIPEIIGRAILSAG